MIMDEEEYLMNFSFFSLRMKLAEKSFKSLKSVNTTRQEQIIRGRYMRCSTQRSGRGAKLDLGARVMKKKAPKNPIYLYLYSVHAVIAMRSRTMITYGNNDVYGEMITGHP